MESQAHLLQPRPYQLEMFEESMKQNVIVAMNTGTGKTHVAVLRIDAALQRCRSDQLAWFLAPKVTLCEQQHRVLREALPAYEHLFLCGADDVDKWSEKCVWDAVLKNVRVVVSTPDVLGDALTHGFVVMSQIALLVFDEAHHCAKRHKMNLIMRDKYHDGKRKGGAVPDILGLTASPVRKMRIELVSELQTNLDAIIVTPTVHRSELAQHSNRPVTRILQYDSNTAIPSAVVRDLETAYRSYDFDDDPYVVDLRSRALEDGDDQSVQLRKVFAKRKTYCSDQVSKLLIRCTELDRSLGAYAAEWFLLKCKEKLEAICQHADDNFVTDWTEAEKAHLLTILGQICDGCESQDIGNPCSRTPKFGSLLDELESTASRASSTPTCIVFAQQRATVAVLSHLLAIHASAHYRVGSFVGSSANAARKANVSDLADVQTQNSLLEAFRSGGINLVVSTDVLEEGIDVPACNLIVCFDPPPHLISFVQRRGRARQGESDYTLLFPQQSTNVNEWQTAEQMLQAYYADEDRRIRDELRAEDLVEPSERELYVQETGALLTLDNVLGHLHHFCSTLHGQFIDVKPHFTVEIEESGVFRSASVLLPATLDPALRMGQSQSSWRSERRAKQDAAFVAYKQLYDVGLINEHLLPAIERTLTLEEDQSSEMAPSLVTVKPLFDPWLRVAQLWDEHPSEVFNHQLTFKVEDRHFATSNVLLPVALPVSKPFYIEFAVDLKFAVSINVESKAKTSVVPDAQKACLILNKAVFRNQNPSNASDFIAILFPNVPASGLSEWISQNHRESRLQIKPQKGTGALKGLVVFDETRYNVPNICLESRTAIPSPGSELANQQVFAKPGLCAVLQRLPRPRNFLQPISEPQAISDKALRSERLVSIDSCTTNSILWHEAFPAYIMPSLLRHTRNVMVAEQLRTTVLKQLHITSNDLILAAICSSNAREIVSYQRLEFLGDCILKFLTAMHLMAQRPQAPEAQLSAAKDRLVSNQRLTKAALALGLDQFIINEPFNGDYVKPLYVQQVLDNARKASSSRNMSRKTLADVVESLIGAAYVEGAGPDNNVGAGLAKATECISLFIDDFRWEAISSLKPRVLVGELPPRSRYEAYNSGLAVAQHDQVQKLLNHQFAHPPLLTTALTHASQNTDPSQRVYDRLEFLGDALLDFIVTMRLFCENPTMPHPRLHTLRQCCVNGDFLAHVCMSNKVAVDRNLKPRPSSGLQNPALESQETTPEHALWHFMRWNLLSSNLKDVMQSASGAHASFFSNISSLLAIGSKYPWAHLMSMGAPKCMSDVIESSLAAVWLDTDTTEINEAFSAAEGLLEHLGIMTVMRKLASDDQMDCMTPKERVNVLRSSESIEYRTEASSNPDPQNSHSKDMVLAIAETEIARMTSAKPTMNEAMHAGKVSELNQWRLSDLAIAGWDAPGGGAEVVAAAKAKRAAEKAALKAAAEEEVALGRKRERESGGETSEEGCE